MRIMLVADHYPPLCLGGGETHVESLATSLHESGHEVVVFTLANANLPEFEIRKGIRIYRYNGLFQRASFLFKNPATKLHPPISDPLIVRKLRTVIEREKPSVLHVHSSGGWILFSVLSTKKYMNIPICVTLHNYGLLCPILTLTRNGMQCRSVLTTKCITCGMKIYGRKSLLVYLFLKFNRMKLRLVDKFIAISQYQKSKFAESREFDERNFAVITNGVDCGEFSAMKFIDVKARKESTQLDLDQDANVIVHISSLNINKLSSIRGILGAAPKIVQKFPHTQILLVGGGERFKYVAELAERVNQRLGRRTIIMTGFVKNDDMPKIIGIADIVVGVGRVVLEAMACEKPVIVAGTSIGPLGGSYGGIVRLSNVNEQNAHNFSGRHSSEKTTPEKITQDCLELLGNEELRLSLGTFGRKYVEQEHDIRKDIRRLEEIYANLVSKTNQSCM